MPNLPLCLNIRDKRCLIVGGGPVALRRTRALLEAGAAVAVVAEDCEPDFQTLPIELHQRTYKHGDTKGAFLVIAATDNPQVNETVANDARADSALVNRVDAPESGDFIIPAHSYRGPIMLAVSTDGISAAASATIRDQVLSHLDEDWLRLLACAQPYRAKIQQQVQDADLRQKKLRCLSDDKALAILKGSGEDALRAYYETL